MKLLMREKVTTRPLIKSYPIRMKSCIRLRMKENFERDSFS